MATYRFNVGTSILCNLGERGWKLGRVVALNYREQHWPEGASAPYQVALQDDEEEYALIYVPEDDERYCREPSPEDIHVLGRQDALAAPLPGTEAAGPSLSAAASNLCSCSDEEVERETEGTAATLAFRSQRRTRSSYRRGRCFCCDDCPRKWSYAELYSEHYLCASRNGRGISRVEVDLGAFHVGEHVAYTPRRDDDTAAAASGAGGFHASAHASEAPTGPHLFRRRLPRRNRALRPAPRQLVLPRQLRGRQRRRLEGQGRRRAGEAATAFHGARQRAAA